MNECPSGAIAQLTFLCQRSDSLVSYDIVFSKNESFLRFSRSWLGSSPMSSAMACDCYIRIDKIN